MKALTCVLTYCLKTLILLSIMVVPLIAKVFANYFVPHTVKENHFICDGELYDQVDGVAMGSPLGPILANMFMCALEKRY